MGRLYGHLLSRLSRTERCSLPGSELGSVSFQPAVRFRRVIVKVEVDHRGINRRFVVTNRDDLSSLCKRKSENDI